jgi:hypothetical protein
MILSSSDVALMPALGHDDAITALVAAWCACPWVLTPALEQESEE